jgi:hypothetical protein
MRLPSVAKATLEGPWTAAKAWEEQHDLASKLERMLVLCLVAAAALVQLKIGVVVGRFAVDVARSECSEGSET